MSNDHVHVDEQQLQDMLQVLQQRLANHVSNYEMQIAHLNSQLAKAQRELDALQGQLDEANATEKDK